MTPLTPLTPMCLCFPTRTKSGLVELSGLREPATVAEIVFADDCETVAEATVD